MNRPLSPKPARSLLLGLTVAALLCLGVTAAAASPVIEGVWSFNGGAVDIQAQPGGTFRGVITSPTKFAQCSHPVNEDVWTEMRLQADGSYFGLHRWYFEGSCTLNPILGPTAWRVLQSPTGSHFLRVCFSEPGSASQPTIAADGSSAGVTYGCTDSASISRLPTVVANEGAKGHSGQGQISFRRTVGLPTARKCVRERTIKIVLHDPPYDPLKEVVIRIKGHKLADVRNIKKLKKAIVLKKLPNGSFKIKVVAITVLNQRLSGSRTYHSCKGKRSGKIKLHHTKPRQTLPTKRK